MTAHIDEEQAQDESSRCCHDIHAITKELRQERHSKRGWIFFSFVLFVLCLLCFYVIYDNRYLAGC